MSESTEQIVGYKVTNPHHRDNAGNVPLDQVYKDGKIERSPFSLEVGGKPWRRRTVSLVYSDGRGPVRYQKNDQGEEGIYEASDQFFGMKGGAAKRAAKKLVPLTPARLLYPTTTDGRFTPADEHRTRSQVTARGILDRLPGFKPRK